VGFDRLPFLGTYRGNRSIGIERSVSHMTDPVANAALESLAVEELPEQHRIEVVPVPEVEGEILGRLRGTPRCCKACGDKETIRMRVYVRAFHTCLGVVDELRHGQVVQH